MKSFRFDPAGDLITVTAVVAGPRRPFRARLALDTGCSTTILIPEVVAELGYGEADMVRRTVIRSPLGDERGYLLHVKRFTALVSASPTSPSTRIRFPLATASTASSA